MHKKDFSKDVSSEAISYEFSAGAFQDRELVSGITIDSPASKDLDDGIFLSKRGDNFLVQVSIADVSTLVKPGSSVFNEALNRLETRYFQNYNIPMLPEILSEKRLSLLEDEPRPALTFEIEISPDFVMQNVSVKETLFLNRRRLSYAAFDHVIAHQKDDPDYGMLVECSNLSQLLLEKRRQNGALAIYDLKRLIFTTEEGVILPLQDQRAHKANIVVQEFMILTNSAVARLFADKGIPLLYRNHTIKQNSPGREEIISQFNSAILNPNLLNALRRRSGYWFNKATYDPVLKGHFGLNEAAYTHVTSPLRRMPDLINHCQIKNYLSGKEPFFTHDELLSFSGNINKKMLQIRNDRSAFFKDKAQEKMRFFLNHLTHEELVEMKTTEFKQLLKEAVFQNVVSDRLEQALLKRMESDSIDPSHLYTILFGSGDEDEKWQNIRRKALEFASEKVGYCSQILNFDIQNGKLTGYETDIVENSNGFIARIIGTLEGTEVSTTLYATGASKQEAQHKAGYDFLRGLLDNSLVPSSQTRMPKEPSQAIGKPSNTKLEENYVGKLTELCSVNKDWSMPAYNFHSTGPTNKPIITCECILTTDKTTIRESAKGGSKKIVKQLASKKILDVVKERGLYVPEKAPEPEQPIRAEYEAERNYVGLLQEACQKNKWDLPDYNYNQSGEAHNLVFKCTLVFKKEEGVLEFNGAAASKKVAKQIATFNCLKYIYSV